MSKVITVSRHFLQGHPKAGQPTYFPEKIIRAFCPTHEDICGNTDNKYFEYYCELAHELQLLGLSDFTPKLHTIRSGKRWKTGDMCSLRVWGGKPYKSKQIAIAPDFALPRVADIEIDGDFRIVVDGNVILPPSSITLATNDGLRPQDLEQWFKKSLPFSGQIIFFSDTKTPY